MRFKRLVVFIIVISLFISNVSCCLAADIEGIVTDSRKFQVFERESMSDNGSTQQKTGREDAVDVNAKQAQNNTGVAMVIDETDLENNNGVDINAPGMETITGLPQKNNVVAHANAKEKAEIIDKETLEMREVFDTRSNSIDPREAFGSTMYDNLRGQLQRFGADFFAQARTNTLALAPVGANYVVAPGDQVKITVWGYNEIRANLVVDRDGMLALPQAGVVEAAGLTFDALRKNIEAAYKRIFTDFDLDVSMGRLHTINVYVSGCANRPGAYAVSSMATLIDVLSQAGGPSVQGTMRNIQVKRGNKTISVFDVYRLLLHGDRKGDVRLCDGDIIFIPPVGQLVSAAGNIKRPAVYEVGKGAKLKDLIHLAGGLTSGASKARIQIIRVENNTVRTALEDELSDTSLKLTVADGDLIKFFAVYGETKNVQISGAIRQPGLYAIEDSKTTLKDVITRSGGLLYTASDEAELTRVAVSPTGPVTTRMIVNIKDVVSGKENIKLQRDDYIFIRSIPDWDIYRSAMVGGRVLYPGSYAVKRGETLYSLLKRSGGYGENAFVQGAVFMRESVRVSQQKAIDDMVKRLERDLAAASNEAISTAMTTKDKDFALAEVTQKQQLLTTLKTAKANGRVIIKLPEKLSELKGSAFDFRLEEGDKIYIPERPNTVNVVGAVTMQSAYIFEKGRNVQDYIRLSGGYAPSANARRSYIIHPNGTISKAFNGNRPALVEEGDFIVVPEKMVFSPRLRNASDVIELLSKTVLAIASVHYIFK